MSRLFLCMILFWTLFAPKVEAAVPAKIIREAAEAALKKMGRETGSETLETLTQRTTQLATKYGDEGVEAVNKVGFKAFHYVEEAGPNGEIVVKLMAKRGDDAAWVVQQNSRVAIFAKYGDDAAEAMIKHKEIVEPVIESLGKPAATAMSKVSSQNARRLAMMSADGELARIGRSDELLGVVGKYGDAAMEFIWKNKGALATATVLAAFLADPEPFINGAKDLTAVVAEKIGEPIARSTNWTLVIIFFGTIAALYFVLPRWWRKNRKVEASPEKT